MTLWKCKLWIGYADKTETRAQILVSTDTEKTLDADPFAEALKHYSKAAIYGKKVEVVEVLEASLIHLPFALTEKELK